MEIGYEVKRNIAPEELLRPFYKENKEKYRIGKAILNNGTYVARYAWKMEGLPHNEQFLWILWADTHKQIEEIVNVFKEFAEIASKQIIGIIDSEDFSQGFPLHLEVYMFSDGESTLYDKQVSWYPSDSSPVKGKIFGNIAVIVGQGRKIDFEEKDITPLICSLIACAFPEKRNKFFRYFRWQLWRLLNHLKDLGVNVEELEQIRW
jgi:hypothetical protein